MLYRIGLLIPALLLVAVDVEAINFTFPFPGSADRGSQAPPPGFDPWQFRPQDPSNARGAPPDFDQSGTPPRGQTPSYQRGNGYPPRGGYEPGGGYPPAGAYPPGGGYPRASGYQRGWRGQYGAPSPYRRQQTQQYMQPPRLELELSDRQPYVQENVLLKLRVISDRNLATATPELPSTNDLLLQKVEGPNARTRVGTGGQREIINEFVYTLTPLRSGALELPPLTVAGTATGNGYEQGSGQRYEATSAERLNLQVRPAMASVRPWLPLQDLTMNAILDAGEDVEEGQPVTLALELTAIGATGSQLPSLESQLRSEDFRVYREQTLTESTLSADGKRLEGKRTEYYTLVPHSGGKLQLPEIRLAWWNVTSGSREHAGLPVHTLQVEGESSPFGMSTSADVAGGGGISWFWLPVVGLSLLFLGYWGGVWYKGREPTASDKGPLGERLSAGLRTAKSAAGTHIADFTKRLDPAPLVSRLKPRLRKTLSAALPPSARFQMCVRAADRESDPVAWCERFQETTCHHLQFDTEAPLPGVTGRILSLRPGADREQVQSLMQQLDAALYGKQDIDFQRWKKQFRRQVSLRRGLLSAGGRKRLLRRPRLPELNPQAAV